MPKLSACLWFDQNAQKAAEFYTSLFVNSDLRRINRYGATGAGVSGQKEGTVSSVTFTIMGFPIVAINGGPMFQFTPAMSFFVWCQSTSEIDRLWSELSKDGSTRMELGKYHWSDRYGWVRDRFGVDWQLMLSPDRQAIAPSFLFTDELFGKGQAALDLYTKLFPDAEVKFVSHDPESKTIIHAQFNLGGRDLILMEGKGQHGHKFSEAFSLIVPCENQAEIDHYWNGFLSGGGKESQCGWLKDPFGVTWQIVPSNMEELLHNPQSGDRVMKAMLLMKKLEIAKLVAAAAG